MARGRPSGSKNKSGHLAGGDRKSRKYKKRLEEEKGEQQRRTDDFFKQRKKAVEPPKWTDHPVCEKNFEESQRMLAEVLDHPSMPKGKNVPTLGIIDSTSDNWNVTYDTSPTTDNEAKYYRRAIMPPKCTPLQAFLDHAKGQIENNGLWKCRQYYYRTLESPLACGLGSSPAPDKFYLPDMVRIWKPKEQFHSIQFDYKCPDCKSCSIEHNAQTWRPAFEHNEIRWVYCHRLLCKDCKAMFSSTDPSFLGMLPTSIAESFEFVFPPQGPGVHRVMLRRLSLQIDNHVLFGAWAREVNDLMWEKYFQKCNQYYEVLNDWLGKWPSPSCYDGMVPLHARVGKGEYDGRPIVPYSAFGAAGHHNGIMMTEGLAKTLFRLVEGGKRFQYNQNSSLAISCQLYFNSEMVLMQPGMVESGDAMFTSQS